jgi:hypothetical protein
VSKTNMRLAALHIPLAEPDALHRVCEVCMHFSPTLEPTPPHGLLVDLSGSRSPNLPLLQAEAVAACQNPVWIGVASTRWVARCAVAYLLRLSSSAVDSSLRPLVIASGREREFLAPLSVSYLTESETADAGDLIERLRDLGVYTFDELACVPAKELTAQFGTRKGPLLRRLATGEDPRTIRSLYPPHRVVASFRVAPDSSGVLNTQAVDQVLLCLSTELAVTLEQRGIAARRMRLEITWREGFLQPSCLLRQPAFRRDALLGAARRLWASASITAPVLELRLYGENLELPRLEQSSIFDANAGANNEELAGIVRSVQNRFGVRALQRASQLPLSRRELVRSMWEREQL